MGNNIIIVGTPKWSSEPDVAASDPVGGTNLAYTVHFYAATHGESLRSRVLNAKVWGQAVFATEWGTCEASGDGYVDVGSTHTWLGFLAHHHISDANWAIADKNEACAALQPGASANGGWPRSMLTESGKYIKDGLTGNWWQVGCCKFGNDCADCGEDGTGWCHQSPGNCAVCGGWTAVLPCTIVDEASAILLLEVYRFQRCIVWLPNRPNRVQRSAARSIGRFILRACALSPVGPRGLGLVPMWVDHF